MSDESMNCYTGACPECGAVLAVAVAPVQDPQGMRRALSAVAEMRRDKLVIGNASLGDVRAGRVLAPDGCAPTCVTGQKAAAREARRKAREAASAR